MTPQELDREVSRAIDARLNALAEAITARQYELHPELAERYGAAGRAKCLQDAGFHLSYLAESISASQPSLFADYIAWAKVMLEGRGIAASDLGRNLEIMSDALRQTLPKEMAEVASEYVESGLMQLPQLPSDLPTCIGVNNPLAQLAKQYLNALLRGERHVASKLILDAVEGGASVKDIYLNVFERCQHEIGRLWQMNLLSVAQEHYCTAATQLIMSQLYPHILDKDKNGRTLVATCVAGDLHEIGVRMVSDFFEMEGWDTFYLGANAPTTCVLETLAERDVDVLAVSATMTPHVSAVAGLITAVRSSRVGQGIKIMVGGYPFNIAPDLWQSVGADAGARDARESVMVANQLAA
ncbi:MAG TPA: cobalamin-dependent protein [Pyrinomonadaceae bacterium]|nr:cobalamin-dependent protein [Pyrinomonadaceae bacterium]